jgi:hypothetical protein
MNNNTFNFRKYVPVFSIMLAIFLIYSRFSSLYPFAATWDQVDFVLAVRDFDVLNMQPHFPGYPFFILGGRMIGAGLYDGPKALSFFNQLLILSSCIPIFLLARKWLSPLSSLMTVFVVQSLSYPAVIGLQPMSEGAAVAIVFWYLWSIDLAIEKQRLIFDILPLVFFSFLLGIRLSYISYGVGLLYLLYRIWKRNEPYRRIQLFILVLFAALLQFLWIGAIAVNVGGFSTLWSIAFGFSEGHFSDWGGTAEAERFILRIGKLIFFNIIWVGILSESIWLLIAFLGLIASICWKSSEKLESLSFYRFLVVCTGCYFIWALFAQNIDKPRHILPIALWVIFLLVIKALQKKSRVISLMVIVWIVGHTFIGYHLQKLQASEQPAVYQLAEYVSSLEKDWVLFTWEETRSLSYLNVPIKHKRVFDYQLFLSDILLNKNQRILITNHVLEGFKQQGIKIEGKVKELQTFSSNPLFDPIYSNIVLYEWVE